MSAGNGWIKIAASIEEIVFAANNIAALTVAGKSICIAKWKEDYFAFAQKCPHASSRFSDGFVDALGNVVCPVHRYKFCLKNGRNVSGEGYYLSHWPLSFRTDGVYICFENKMGLQLF